MEYIHYNPVEAGFVEHEEDYLYSCPRDFLTRRDLLNYVMWCRCQIGISTSVMLALG